MTSSELRLRRVASGLSRYQVGRRLGLSARQVGKFETGHRVPRTLALQFNAILPTIADLFFL